VIKNPTMKGLHKCRTKSSCATDSNSSFWTQIEQLGTLVTRQFTDKPTRN